MSLGVALSSFLPPSLEHFGNKLKGNRVPLAHPPPLTKIKAECVKLKKFLSGHYAFIKCLISRGQRRERTDPANKVFTVWLRRLCFIQKTIPGAVQTITSSCFRRNDLRVWGCLGKASWEALWAGVWKWVWRQTDGDVFPLSCPYFSLVTTSQCLIVSF